MSVDVHSTFDARGRARYFADINHPGLKTYKRITGSDPVEVQQKATAQLAQWEKRWQDQQTKEAATQVARQAKEHEQKLLAERRERARKLTVAAQAEIDALNKLLDDTLAVDDTIDWNVFTNDSSFSKPHPHIPRPVLPKPNIPKPKPTPPASPQLPKVPRAPLSSDAKYQPQLSTADRLLPSRRKEKEQAAFRLYQQDHAAWLREKERIERQILEIKRSYNTAVQASTVQIEAKWAEDVRRAEQEWQTAQRRAEEQWAAQIQRANQDWETERAEFELNKAKHNATVSQVRSRYMAGAEDAVRDYCISVLRRSKYPDCLANRELKVSYNGDTKTLVIEYNLPRPDEIPRIKEVKYIKSRNAFEEVLLLPAQHNELFDTIIYQIAIRTLHELFEADAASAIDSITFNGWVTFTDKGTGQQSTACILSVQTTKQEFSKLNLAHVDAKSCFKQLKGVGSAKLHGLAAVAPLLQLEREDKRFVSSYEVAEKLDEGTNLAAMDWEDFEHLIRELFEREFIGNGGEVKVTQASRDGGVDAIAFDPDPIRGGKIVIQAKRYTNVVGVSAVRDLYGTVVNEGAIKGILVTTADYGPDAYEFARNKPLTLLNGGNLLHLLQKHGHKARIDIREAKQMHNQP